MTTDMETALRMLREWAEGAPFNGYANVYLDNAKPKGWSDLKWAGTLGALKKAGLYRPYDDPDFAGIWGDVKMDD